MDHLIAAVAARRFHLEGASKTQIASELGLSRFKVARILEDALRDGIVKIEVVPPANVDLDLSEEISRRFGVRQALVVRSDENDDDRPARDRRLGVACASVLSEMLTEESVLGVSWGQTLHALVDVLPELPRTEVVQMVGGVPNAALHLNSMELVRRLGECTGGVVRALHAPLVVSDAAVAAGLKADQHVKETFEAFGRITHALVGVGSWDGDRSALKGMLPEDLVATLTGRGAVADVCSTVIDATGRALEVDRLEAHCLSVTERQLRQIPDVTAIAGGAEKARAIAAAVRAGLVHRLIIDTGAARELQRVG